MSSILTTISLSNLQSSPSENSTENFPTQKSTLNLLYTKCNNSLENLKQVHALILKTGLFKDHFIAGSLIKCYAYPKFRSFTTSLQLLERVSEPNVFVWNCVIKGCLDNKVPFRAISFYSRMAISSSKPNKYTYPLLFKACAIEQAVVHGLQIHGHVLKHGLFADEHIVSSGIQMYVSFGLLKEARRVFDALEGSGDVICCNAMIDGYMKFGDVDSAVVVFDNMHKRNNPTWNTMITGFSSNGMIEEAQKYFNQMPEKDEISWSAMLDGYNKTGQFKEALDVFNRMRKEGIEPSKFILSSALAACAHIGAFDQAKWIDSYIKKNKLFIDPILGTSLIDMYAKCGRLDLAWKLFEDVNQREVFTWNALISGLAMHGRGEDAIDLFFKMQRNDKIKPNEITFVSLLNACAHAGLIKQGLKYFFEMKEKYELEPTVEHYGCVVNLLGKAGFLTEAEELINSMPMKPDSAVYGALLAACRIHKNEEIAERIGKISLDLEPENSGRYTLLSNIYAKAQEWDKAEEIRKVMKERGVKSIAGTSTISVKGVLHEFKVGDFSHPQKKRIYQMLGEIMQKIKSKGYVADTSRVLFDISEEEKECSLAYHSEKLAIAFGLLNTEPGEVIRVVKNLRVCEDCHNVTKLISQVYEREIIVRDRVRYHCFKEGLCSCNDFW